MPEPVRILAPARHERQDVAFRSIALAGAAIAVGVTLVLLAVWWSLPRTGAEQFESPNAPRFAAPELQASPPRDMQRFREEQMQALDGAYWLDREHGTVHLPIADAMRKVAQEGIRDWPAPPR